jgi:hypothetical protein
MGIAQGILQCPKTLERTTMKIRIILFAGLFLVLGSIAGVSAAIVTTPTDLVPGQSYRLAFVTSTTRDATSTNIGDYNKFVDDLADLQPDLVALGTTWTAIATTAAIDARDNTGTNPGLDGDGVPIYLLDGTTLIANDNNDLWDGSIQSPLNITEQGTALGTGLIWTGTNSDGTGIVGARLGEGVPIVGDLPSTNSLWVIRNFAANNGFNLQLYALSDVLTVATVPLPPALPLMGLAVAGLGFVRKRKAA